jgi:hypothetical protein
MCRKVSIHLCPDTDLLRDDVSKKSHVAPGAMLLLWSGRNDTAALRVVCHASGFRSLEHLGQRKKSRQYVEESACEPLPVMYLALWHYPRHKASRSARAFLGRLAPEGLHPEGMPRAPRDDRLRLACATLSARGWPARAASLDS